MVCYIVRYITSGPSSLLIIEVIESADAKSISSHILHFLPLWRETGTNITFFLKFLYGHDVFFFCRNKLINLLGE